MKSVTVTLFALLIASIAAGPALGASDKAVALNNEGKELFSQARYSEALQKFVDAIDADSVYSEARVNAARVAEKLEDWANVKFQYLTVLTYDKDNIDALVGAGNYFVRVENYDEAKGYFDRALKIDQGNATVHFGLGTMYHKMKNTKKARLEYKKTIALDPENFPLAYYRLGRYEFETAAKTKDFSKAADYLSSYLERGKDGDILYSTNMDLATIQIRKKAYAKAIDYYAAAKLIKPSEWKPYFYTAEALRAQKKMKQAEKEYLATLERKPGHGESHYRLAVMYQQNFEDDKALEHYKAAAKDRSFKNRKAASNAAAALEDYLKKVKEAEAG